MSPTHWLPEPVWSHPTAPRRSSPTVRPPSRPLIADGAVFDRGSRRPPPAHPRGWATGVRRIIHAGGDATGAQVQRSPSGRLPRPLPPGSTSSASTTPWRRRYCSPATVADRGPSVAGVAYIVDDGGEVRREAIAAPVVLPATGGRAPVFRDHQPDWRNRRRCRIGPARRGCGGRSEFIQFHPTMLYVPGARGRRSLVSEALRGEGGASSTSTATRLPPVSTRWATCTPRRRRPGVEAAIERTGADCVYLDTTPLHDFATRFPTVLAGIKQPGRHHRRQDPGCARRALPVRWDRHRRVGATTVPGLLAAGNAPERAPRR